MRPGYINQPRCAAWMFCTQCCSGTVHICCGGTVPESQGLLVSCGICSTLHYQVKVFEYFFSKQSQAVCMRPGYINQPRCAAWMSCTQSCTGTVHICCGGTAPETQGLLVSSDEAPIAGMHQVMMFHEHMSKSARVTQQVSPSCAFH